MSHCTYAVVLAAGLGTRMRSKTPKVLHTIGGKPMVGHLVDTLEQLQVDEVIMVIGHGSEAIRDYLGERVRYVLQKDQLGTAHAVKQAAPLLRNLDGTTLIVNGDNPLITVETYRSFLREFENKRFGASMLTATVPDPSGYGRVVRTSEGDVERVVEHRDATEAERNLCEINTGTFCFDNRGLFLALEKVDNDNAQGEYYLPDALQVLRSEGKKIGAYQVADPRETVGINNRVQLAEAEAIFRERMLHYHMEQGVTVMDPNHTYIEADVNIGRDTTLYPGTILKGRTIIGEDCIIGPGADIQNCQIANGVTIKHATVIDSTIETGADIGPYAYVRPNSQIGPRVKIGDFVEVKNSVIGADTKVSHLSYIGDSDLGQEINIGCGTVTVNYDGLQKRRTVVGDRVFIGCNTNLIAPVKIDHDAYIAAGSTVTDDVPEKGFAIARQRQTTKEDYAPKLKARLKSQE